MVIESSIGAFPRPTFERKFESTPTPEQTQKPTIAEIIKQQGALAKDAVVRRLEEVREKLVEVADKAAGLERSMELSGINQTAVLEAIHKSGGNLTTKEILSYLEGHHGLRTANPNEAYKKIQAVAAGLTDSTKSQDREGKPLRIHVEKNAPAVFVAKNNEQLGKHLQAQRQLARTHR